MLLLLALVSTQVHAQGGPPAWGLSTDEIIERLIASRPKGKRTLVTPKLFDTLEEKSWEQNVQPTGSGMDAWRDIYGKEGSEEFALRQLFVPLKSWKLKTPKQMLDDARTQMVDGTQAGLLEERDYTLDGCPCRTFVVRHPATGKVVRLDYLLIFPDLFIVSCSGTETALKSPKISRFFSELKTEPVK
jgi:hypothetical protein